MMGHKRAKRGKQDIGETYATYWIRKHQAEMCRYQPIVRENSMVTLRTNQIPERGFIREGSLMNLKSSPRKKNEFNFARDLSLSGEATFFRDRDSFFRDPMNFYDRHGSCNSSERRMDRNSFAGNNVARGSSQSGSGFLPDKSRRLFERWDSHQDNVIPQRKYTILPQIGNPRFISIQESRHQFVNQLDYSRDNFEKDADFFADYNKSWNHEEVLSVRGVPLPPLSGIPAQLKLNFMYKTEQDISEETSQCYTNSMTLSGNLATSTVDDFSEEESTEEESTINSASGQRQRSEAKVNITGAKNKEQSSSGTEKSNDSSYDSERGDLVCENESKPIKCGKGHGKRLDKEKEFEIDNFTGKDKQKDCEIDNDNEHKEQASEVDNDNRKDKEKEFEGENRKDKEQKESGRYGNRKDGEPVKAVKCKEMLAQTNLPDKSNREIKEKTGYTKKAANTTSQKTTNVKLFKNIRKFIR